MRSESCSRSVPDLQFFRMIKPDAENIFLDSLRSMVLRSGGMLHKNIL